MLQTDSSYVHNIASPQHMLDEVFLSRRGLSNFFFGYLAKLFQNFAGTLNSVLNARVGRTFYTNITPNRLPGQKSSKSNSYVNCRIFNNNTILRPRFSSFFKDKRQKIRISSREVLIQRPDRLHGKRFLTSIKSKFPLL